VSTDIADTSDSPTRQSNVRLLLKNRNLARLVIAEAQSQVGSSMTEATIPLIAAVSLHATPAQVGLLIAISYITLLIGRLSVALRAEKADIRIMTMIFIDLCAAAFVAAVPILFFTGHLTVLLLIVAAAIRAYLGGAYGTFAGPVVIEMVSPDEVTNANSIASVVGNAANIGGPGLAGLVIQLVTLPAALIVDAATYLLSALLVAPLHKRTVIHASRQEFTAAGDGATMGKIRGFLIIFNRNIGPALIGGTLICLVNGLALALLPIYATRDLKLSPGTYAFMLAGGAIGGIVGASMAPRLANAFGDRRCLAIAPFIMLASFAALTVAQPGWRAVAAIVGYELIGSFGAAAYVVLLMSSVPVQVPPVALARAFAVAAISLDIGTAAGAGLGGLLANIVGLRNALLVGLTGGLVALAVLLIAQLWMNHQRNDRASDDVKETNDGQ
jgi:predicted MFS family arabinose efflux permease